MGIASGSRSAWPRWRPRSPWRGLAGVRLGSGGDSSTTPPAPAAASPPGSRRRADDLAVAALRRPGQERHGRPVRARHRHRRQATSRTSTTTRSSSPSSSRCSQQGQSGGRDLITVSDWLARADVRPRLPLRARQVAQLPNVEENLIPALQHPAADPNRDFTVPWQAGMTGLIVRTDLAPGRRLDLRPLRPEVQGQGRRCSPSCATRCR